MKGLKNKMKLIKKYIKALKDDWKKGTGEYLFVIAFLIAIFILFIYGWGFLFWFLLVFVSVKYLLFGKKK